MYTIWLTRLLATWRIQSVILKANSKDGSNLQLAWLRLLVWTLESLEPQSVGAVLGVTSGESESYYRRSIAIPVMDNFINSFRRQNGW